MSTELLDALTILEKDKNISKDTMLDAIESSLISACKNHFGTSDNIKIDMNRETCEYSVYAEKTVVKEISEGNRNIEITLEDAKKINSKLGLGDIAQVPIESKGFGRIATQNAKNLILQKIREEERRAVYEQYFEKEKDIVTGVIQRIEGKKIDINLGRADAILSEKEQVKGEVYRPGEKVKLYVVEVKSTTKGPKIILSRTHPELVRKLFEKEVSEVKDGTVEIKSIAREAGSRTKMAVWSNDENVDPVGACVGVSGARVNNVVRDLKGEKVDVIDWNENPALLIENALKPAKVISVMADPDEKMASVIVPDYQLSLAIGKEGQNARLAARLTGYKIDIKNETQAIESGELPEDYMAAAYDEEYYDEEHYDDYDDEHYDDEHYDDEHYDDEYYDEEYYDEHYDENNEEEHDGIECFDNELEGQEDED